MNLIPGADQYGEANRRPDASLLQCILRNLAPIGRSFWIRVVLTAIRAMEGQMFRLATLGFAILLAATATVLAQSPIERGQYLVNSILACGNCHTPKTASGEPIAEKELSGGLVFSTPAFDA